MTTIVVGNRYKFYTTDTSFYNLNNRIVLVTRKMAETEVDIQDVGDMYEVEFEGGFPLEVFSDELKELHS